MIRYTIFNLILISGLFISTVYSQHKTTIDWRIRLNGSIAISTAPYQFRNYGIFYQVYAAQKRDNWLYGMTLHEYSALEPRTINILYTNYDDIGTVRTTKRDYNYFLGGFFGYVIGNATTLTGKTGLGILYHAERTNAYLEDYRKFDYWGVGGSSSIELNWHIIPYTYFFISNIVTYGISLEDKKSALRYYYHDDEDRNIIEQSNTSKNLFFWGIFFGFSIGL